MLADIRSELGHRSIWWGYVAIIAIAGASGAGIVFYDRILGLPFKGLDSIPFVVFSVTIFMGICLMRPLMLVVRRHPEPLRQIGRDFIAYRGWLVTSALMALALPLALQFSSAMKKSIPLIVPFHADHWIIGFEHSLLGTDAWTYTHAVIGEAGTRIIDLLYQLWHLVNIGLLCWLVLTRDRRFQVRGVLTYQLAWILLGGLLATAWSSVGPCFLELFTGDIRFAPLMDQLQKWHNHKELYSILALEYLLSSQGSDDIGAGISAMPSLHVAIAFLTVQVAFSRSKRWSLRFAALAYFLVILVGSVHLGWHYLLDGLVSIAAMVPLWIGAGKLVDWLSPARVGSHQPN